MPKKLLMPIEAKLDQSLITVGDMALKRRARNIILSLELKEGDKVLEIGCGNGYYLSLLNRLGLKLGLAGIDIDSPALIDAAKFIGDKKVKLILASGSKIPFPKNTFDKVVMSEVIEHVEEEEKVLTEAYRVLKLDGIFALTTCNINYPFLWDPINWVLQHFFNTHIKEGFWAGIWNQHTRLYKKENRKLWQAKDKKIPFYTRKKEEEYAIKIPDSFAYACFGRYFLSQRRHVRISDWRNLLFWF